MIKHVFLFATLGLCTLFGTGCSGADDPSQSMLAPIDTSTIPTPDTSEVCANHEEGCACDTPGDLIDCGRVKRTAGSYVWCSTGMQTCSDDKKWGKCTGDQVAATPAQ